MPDETIGRNASDNFPDVFPLKYSVAAVSPPSRIFRASSKLIPRIASMKICFASGAAFSAARFMLSTNSSTSFRYPAFPRTSATFRMFFGMRIRIASLPKYPSVFDVAATAFPVPIESASFSPATMSASPGPAAFPRPVPFSRSSNVPARAGSAGTIIRNASRHNVFFMASSLLPPPAVSRNLLRTLAPETDPGENSLKR